MRSKVVTVSPQDKTSARQTGGHFSFGSVPGSPGKADNCKIWATFPRVIPGCVILNFMKMQ